MSLPSRPPFSSLLALAAAGLALAQSASGWAQTSSAAHISIDLGTGSGDYVGALKIVLLLGALAMAPSLLLAVTSFTRIVIVLSLLRQAVGVVQLPPNRIVIGLALFLTLFTMAPVWSQIDEAALTPLQAGVIDEKQALTSAIGPLRDFMLRQTTEEDLSLFLSLSKQAQPNDPSELSTLVVVPAFMLSELKAAFRMGALMFLPFLVIDLVVASVLMSMGMMMLPPMTISLPLKLIVFVTVDGWGLVMRSLAESLMW